MLSYGIEYAAIWPDTNAYFQDVYMVTIQPSFQVICIINSTVTLNTVLGNPFI